MIKRFKTNFSFTVLLLTLARVAAEDPFCSNKCYDTGVTTTKNCYCDEICAYLFNDCCGDSEHIRNKYANQKRSPRMSCQLINGKYSLMINTCPANWQGPETIRNSCLHSIDPSRDPFVGVPVTNPTSGITYGNFYCAICNNDAQRMFFWEIRVVCPTLKYHVLDKKDVWDYIFYNEYRHQWGFLLQDKATSAEHFHGCNVTYTTPKHIISKVRECEPEVDECLATWKEDVIKQMCAIYTDPVYANNTRYKNIYCAICNHVDQSQMSCGTAVGPRHHGLPEILGPPNFALLLDINLRYGNEVGKKKVVFECGSGEVYDPFKKVCRDIKCGLPGSQVKDGKCVLKEELQT